MVVLLVCVGGVWVVLCVSFAASLTSPQLLPPVTGGQHWGEQSWGHSACLGSYYGVMACLVWEVGNWRVWVCLGWLVEWGSWGGG